jgi:glycosyltransferase involved in cell wall biosynthesis
MSWQILDVGSIWMKEFAAALSRLVPVTCWEPVMTWTGAFQTWTNAEVHEDPHLTVNRFPLQRGYARFPVSSLLPIPPRIIPMLSATTDDAAESPLVCTTPFYAPVAEQWPGPVVYYQTDLTAAYAGIDPRVVRAMDRRLCRVADIVCPNSNRIAEYMIWDAGCAEQKITIVPNATRQSNIFASLPEGANPLPSDVSSLPRPIAGVIGNLAANMDWIFLRDLVSLCQNVTWLFVGPTHMPVYDRDQREARQRLMDAGRRVVFTGSRPYADLQAYARAFDVAVLPYRKHEPTYSGSSTRFYEHLAACRPIVATRGFAELLSKEPLLRLVDAPGEAADYIHGLAASGFRDGFETLRWRASFDGTWEKRAASMVDALQDVRPSLIARGTVPSV